MSSLETKNVKLLLIEDEADYLKQVVRWMARFGYQHIDTARNVAEARAKLDEKPFDIIVADMRLDRDDDGFAVLDEVKKRHITSVVIILTANDSVADCRRAFKEGAWDYISKNMKGNVFKELNQSIRNAITYFNRWGGKEDEAWIEENMTQLLESYHGQYIAVINNSVIEAAKTEEQLEKRLRERKFPIFLSTIKKIEAFSKPEPLIADLIKQGKNATLEFQSSLQWDVKQNKVNKNLRFAVLKTIAAFLNSEGGTLLIGVADDGAILGLSGDLSLVKEQMLDEFEQTLRKLINSRISAAFSRLIKVRFEKIEGKEICVVEVTRAAGPVFMRGQRAMEFNIRYGSSTRALNSSERHLYIRTHWK